MPFYPVVDAVNSIRRVTDVFAGYNHNPVIADGEFYDEKNMTSDDYPLLSTRKQRGVYDTPGNMQGLIAKDGLCYVDGEDFVMNGKPIHMGLSTRAEDCPKTLVSMGAYVIILPDRKYINTADTEDFGEIEASFTTGGSDVTYTLCDINGDKYENALASETAPVEPKGGDYWIDTSQKPHSLKVYSSTSSVWMSVATTYVKISSPNIGKAFSQYDGVELSGVKPEALSDLNGFTIVWAKGDDYLVVVGLLDAETVQKAEDGAVTVTRQMPNMDYVTESGNRLWGCRYGTDRKGNIVNEIYASKLGDFKNWNCFMGISTDSYVVSCGTDGPFTGAITHLGYPLFFKEECLHKVYGSYPANFQVQQTTCRGVQKGCGKSMAIVNEVLYYKSRGGVCAYDGSLPAEISGAFGGVQYENAVGGGHRNKYYLSMQEMGGSWKLFVYDTRLGVWHKEDETQADAWCACQDEMYYIDHADGTIRTVLGSGTKDTEPVSWMAETGTIVALVSSTKYSDRIADKKFVGRMLIRVALEQGTQMQVFIEYDSSGVWEKLWDMTGTSLRTFSFPVRPHRCDHFRLRLEGTGGAKIYAITKSLEQGSDEL